MLKHSIFNTHVQSVSVVGMECGSVFRSSHIENFTESITNIHWIDAFVCQNLEGHSNGSGSMLVRQNEGANGGGRHSIIPGIMKKRILRTFWTILYRYSTRHGRHSLSLHIFLLHHETHWYILWLGVFLDLWLDMFKLNAFYTYFCYITRQPDTHCDLACVWCVVDCQVEGIGTLGSRSEKPRCCCRRMETCAFLA